jgi:hypothetical protein
MSVEDKPYTQWKQVKSLLQNLAIRGGIVVGALWFPNSKVFANYILLLHWWYWGFAVLMTFAVIIMGIVISPQVPFMDSGSKNLKFLKSFKKINESWSKKVNNAFIVIPSLLFVGIYMGDWSLLIPMLISDVAVDSFFSTMASLHDKLPKTLTTEADLQDIKDVSKDPITKTLEDMKLKKSEEEKLSDSIVDGLMGDK